MNFKPFLLLLLSAFCLHAMQREPGIQGAGVLAPETNPFFGMLPKELRIKIIVAITASKTLEEAINALHNLRIVNTDFKKLIDNPALTEEIIRKLAKRFYKEKIINIAKKLGTPGAKEFIDNKKLMEALEKQLFLAIEKKDLQYIIELINFGADVNAQNSDSGESVLAHAINEARAEHGHMKGVLQMLMARSGEKEEDIPEQFKHFLSVQTTQTDPIMVEIINLLLSKGADVNIRSRAGGSALLNAVKIQNPTLVKLLLHHGANPNVQEFGSTPLHFSIEHGNKEIIKILMQAGADPNIGNSEGLTSIEKAKLLKRKDLLDLLLEK
jgi:hypothetical protein